MDLGVSIPIGNNGWLISTASPQYKPSFDLNREVVQKAERYGFEFALSMIKLRGFGGKSEYWDYNLESFTLMAGLAPVTSKIRLYASTAVLTLPPALIGRMAVTIDSISHGRFGINIVSGWAKGEYEQMVLWPGDEHRAALQVSTEYVTVMKELWQNGQSDFKGEYFRNERLPAAAEAGKRHQAGVGGAERHRYGVRGKIHRLNFILGTGVNTPAAFAPQNPQLLAAAAKTGRDVGAYVLFMVIADETDDAAMAEWQRYKEAVDIDALAWMAGQADADKNAGAGSTARTIKLPEGAVNFNMGTIVGSYATCARLVDEAAAVPGTKGIMLTFDDFLIGMEQFGQRIQSLMACRAAKTKPPPEEAPNRALVWRI